MADQDDNTLEDLAFMIMPTNGPEARWEKAFYWISILVLVGLVGMDIMSRLDHHQDLASIARDDIWVPIVFMGWLPNRFYLLTCAISLMVVAAVLWVELHGRPLTVSAIRTWPLAYWSQVGFFLASLAVLIVKFQRKKSIGGG